MRDANEVAYRFVLIFVFVILKTILYNMGTKGKWENNGMC